MPLPPWLAHRPGPAPALIALLALAGLGVALVAQHRFDVRPCPWCVMQRGIFLLIAAAGLAGWLAQRLRPLHRLSLALVLVLCGAGLLAAWYQHQVVSQLASCDLTLADRILTALNLEELWPPLFMVTANCAQAAAYKLLGLPYELWSAGLFGLLAALAALGLFGRSTRH